MSPLEPEITTRMPGLRFPAGPAGPAPVPSPPPSQARGWRLAPCRAHSKGGARDCGCGVTGRPVVATSGALVGVIVGVLVALFFVIVFLSSAIKVVTEYERSVFFRLGHVRPEAKGPGGHLPLPIVAIRSLNQ